MKILVIAKGNRVVDTLAGELRSSSVDLRSARTARAVFESLRHIDAVLVGFAADDLAAGSVGVCRAIRARSDVPIVALVDTPETGRHVLALRAGVNEFLCKPYRAAALVARLDMLRRSRTREPDPPDKLLLDDVTINFRGRTITVAGRTLQLTNRQYQILALLAEHYGAVCPKNALISRIWGDSWYGADQSLYVHINALRGKIGRPRVIQTVRGEGYRLASPCAMAS
ncbi:response regulator transcription factor [Pseudonocardia eucalypti]|uniref:Response regulator transcription factor n=1 Tax=Pseudonocardia eucalypti TaxID=648755 RepID=A0ABP9R7K1_9PSEU|nr:DNA-binding response OmpR family regulator [Pseudonocardia eucalypti]